MTIRSFAHVANPVCADSSLDLMVAPPTTIASMQRALTEVRGALDVRIFSDQYLEDNWVLGRVGRIRARLGRRAPSPL
jgi:hypothetical protein